jgi:hypothetical protein
VQHKKTAHEVGLIAIIYNIGAVVGGIFFDSLSERLGRAPGTRTRVRCLTSLNQNGAASSS